MPGNTRAGQQLANHRRYHTKRGIRKSSCAICVAESTGVLLPNPKIELQQPEPQQLVSSLQETEFTSVTTRLASEISIPFDYKNRMLSFASLGMTVEQAASAFDVDVPTFQQWMKNAYNGRTWDQLLETAPETVANKVLATCISKALRGDIKFLTLLEEWGKIPGFAKLRETVAPDIHVKVNDLSKVSTEYLQRERQRLIAVIDAPKRLEKFIESKTLSTRAATTQEIDEFYSQERGDHSVKTLSYDGEPV